MARAVGSSSLRTLESMVCTDLRRQARSDEGGHLMRCLGGMGACWMGAREPETHNLPVRSLEAGRAARHDEVLLDPGLPVGPSSPWQWRDGPGLPLARRPPLRPIARTRGGMFKQVGEVQVCVRTRGCQGEVCQACGNPILSGTLSGRKLIGWSGRD